MADNVTVNASGGTAVVATDEVGGAQIQRVKPTWGVDGSATDVSRTNPLPTSDATDGALTSSAVSVTTSATALPASPASGRKRVLIQNLAAVAVYLGSASVTTANGIELSPKATLTLPLGSAVLYGRVATGTADVRVLEFA
jgi:hypothetical protein